MGWKISHLKSLGIVEMRLAGAVTGNDLRAATKEGISLANKLKVTRGLVDCTDQEKTGSMVDLIELPQQYTDQGLGRDTRIGLVIPTRKELHEIAEFYKTACVNRGWQVKTFGKRDAAIAWLATTPDFV